MAGPHTKEEEALRRQGYQNIAGADEAGKGAWAGPLVAAAVILPSDFAVRGVKDSKQLTPRQRERLFVSVTKRSVSWAVGVIDRQTIDRIGIQRANVRALEAAVAKLHVPADAVLVDAVKTKHGRKPVKAIIKGDAKVLSIAAASIVAKVVRDTLMNGVEREFPGYGFAVHKGYGTPQHDRALRDRGLSQAHRKSFSPMKDMLQRSTRTRRKSHG